MDTNATALPYDRPFDNRIDIEGSGNLRHRELRVLKAHHGGTGNDAQVMDSGKTPDDFLGHPVSKVLLRWVARQILQRQHRHRIDFRMRSVLCAAADRDVSQGQQGEHRHRSQNEPPTSPRVLAWLFIANLRLFRRDRRFFLLVAYDWGNEPIPAARQCFYKTRIVGGIAQRVAQFVDGGVQAVFEVNEGVRRPVLVPQFLPRHHFTRPLQQHR